MRAALLTPADGAAADPAVLGVGVLDRQADFALARDCTLILLHAPQFDTGHGIVMRLHRRVERAGARFVLLRRARDLVGLLSAQDRLLVLGAGVLPVGGEAADLLGSAPVLLRVAADGALARGLQELDARWHWAGALVVPGGAVERLAELGEGSDPVSALVRIARFSGMVEREVPPRLLADGQWAIVDDATAARALGDRLAAERIAGHAHSPLARRVMPPIARRLVESGRTWRGAGALTLVVAIAATVFAQRGWPRAALVGAIVAVFLFRLLALATVMAEPGPARARLSAILRLAPVWPIATAMAALYGVLLYEVKPFFALYGALVPVAAWLIAGAARRGRGLVFGDPEAMLALLLLAGVLDRWAGGVAIVTALALGGIAYALEIARPITRA